MNELRNLLELVGNAPCYPEQHDLDSIYKNIQEALEAPSETQQLVVWLEALKAKIAKQLARDKKLWSQMAYAEVDEPPAFWEGQKELIGQLIDHIRTEFKEGDDATE